MNVVTEDLRKMKPGQIKPFLCEDAFHLDTASTLVSRIKRLGMPEGVVDFEVQKFFDDNIILIHAMGETCTKVLNK